MLVLSINSNFRFSCWKIFVSCPLRKGRRRCSITKGCNYSEFNYFCGETLFFEIPFSIWNELTCYVEFCLKCCCIFFPHFQRLMFIQFNKELDWKGKKKKRNQRKPKSIDRYPAFKLMFRVLISVLFPRLCRLIWGNPDSIIKEIFVRGMQNPDNYWFWNRESWDLKSGIQAKRSGIPLTIVPRTKNPEYVNFCKLHSLGVFNY